jgi:hypothetical protein
VVYDDVWPRGPEFAPEPLVEPLALLVPVPEEPLPVLDVDDDEDPLEPVVEPEPLGSPLPDCPEVEPCPAAVVCPTCASGPPRADDV